MIDIDADLENADWPKSTWDLYDREQRLVTTVQQLLDLGYTRERLEALTALPAYRAAPTELRRELAEYLART